MSYDDFKDNDYELFINNQRNTINISWSKNFADDYECLMDQFAKCSFVITDHILSNGYDHRKVDAWFITAIFCMRHSLELGLKSLLFKRYSNPEVQEILLTVKHNLSSLFTYINIPPSSVQHEQFIWLESYIKSVEKFDPKSDTFRYPFNDKFKNKYNGKFLDISYIRNNMLQAYYLIKLIIHNGINLDNNLLNLENETINLSYRNICLDRTATFLKFTKRIDNCYIDKSNIYDDCINKIVGYKDCIQFYHNYKNIESYEKAYPILFMLRNLLELLLKKNLSIIAKEIEYRNAQKKLHSHNLIKDLWPYLRRYLTDNSLVNSKILEEYTTMIKMIHDVDKEGFLFRYPTSYSLEYKFNNKVFDLDYSINYILYIADFLENEMYAIEDFNSITDDIF